MISFWLRRLYGLSYHVIGLGPTCTNGYLGHYFLWSVFYSGCYIDEWYARTIESLFRSFFVGPALYILDSWWSQWYGSALVSSTIGWFSSFLYYSQFTASFLVVLFSSFLLGSVLLAFLLPFLF